jgi:hypothetical protein
MVKDLHAWGGIFATVSNSLGKMRPLNNECGIIVSQVNEDILLVSFHF